MKNIKEKILTFIIGFLVGAIITAGGFLIYSKVNNTNQVKTPMGEPPEMMNEGNREFKGKPENSGSENSNSETTENSNESTNKTNKKSKTKSESNNEQSTPTEVPEGNNGNKSEKTKTTKSNNS